METPLINSEQLCLITGLGIRECRKIFADNYLPNKTSFDVLEKCGVDNIVDKWITFKKNWINYHDNMDYVLNEPFKSGEFKLTRKIKFIIENIDGRVAEIIKQKWQRKTELLKNQLSFS